MRIAASRGGQGSNRRSTRKHGATWSPRISRAVARNSGYDAPNYGDCSRTEPKQWRARRAKGGPLRLGRGAEISGIFFLRTGGQAAASPDFYAVKQRRVTGAFDERGSCEPSKTRLAALERPEIARAAEELVEQIYPRIVTGGIRREISGGGVGDIDAVPRSECRCGGDEAAVGAQKLGVRAMCHASIGAGRRLTPTVTISRAPT